MMEIPRDMVDWILEVVVKKANLREAMKMIVMDQMEIMLMKVEMFSMDGMIKEIRWIQNRERAIQVRMEKASMVLVKECMKAERQEKASQ